MSAADGIYKNFNLIIETVSFAGNCDEIQPPALKVITDDHRVGGLDAPIPVDMGMEKLQSSFSLTKHDPFANSTVAQSIKNLSVTARGAIQDFDGKVKAVVMKMTGRVTSYEPGAWKAGEKPVTKFTMDLIYYHHAVDGVPLHIIDAPNMVRIIGGVDQLAAIRDAIGLPASAASVGRNIVGI